MDLKPPTCNHADCLLTLERRPAMARRGDRTVSYVAECWRCARCADPDTGAPPLEFLDDALIRRNEAALAAAWRDRYGEGVPPSGRPGPKTGAPREERLAVLLTSDELARLDARRGRTSRSEFVRALIMRGLDERRT